MDVKLNQTMQERGWLAEYRDRNRTKLAVFFLTQTRAHTLVRHCLSLCMVNSNVVDDGLKPKKNPGYNYKVVM